MHDEIQDSATPDIPAPGTDTPDEAVGYGRPPRHARFRPGRSGNPRGRPRGSRDLAALLQAELERPVTVTEGGQRRQVSKAAVLIAVQVNKALKGDTRAFNSVLQATRPRPGAADAADDVASYEEDLADARRVLAARLARLSEDSAAERERMAERLAAAGLPEAQLDLLLGPRGERQRQLLTAALLAARAAGVDIREVAAASPFRAVDECAAALLGEAAEAEGGGEAAG